MSTPGYTPAELDALVERQLDQALDAGLVIRNVAGWRRDCRARTIENEQAKPGYIHRLTLSLAAKDAGRTLTRCREVRGSHGVDHVSDPEGTDPVPTWWNPDRMRREWEAQRAS